MTFLEAIIFGIVQGITEFLPISSSAHIVILQLLFGYTFTGLSFEVFLHLASVIAVIIYFRRDLWVIIKGFFLFLFKKDQESRTPFYFGVYILVATGITAILGLFLEDRATAFLKTPPFIAGALAVTGLALVFIERFHKVGDKTEETMTIFDSILVGLGQTLAVIPGISRSGSTLVISLLAGLNRETAVRYSFLLSIPAILGSTLLTFGDITMEMINFIGPVNLVVSFAVTFIFSIIGIIWLIDFLKKSKLIYFAIYCFLLAAFVFFYFDAGTVLDI